MIFDLFGEMEIYWMIEELNVYLNQMDIQLVHQHNQLSARMLGFMFGRIRTFLS